MPGGASSALRLTATRHNPRMISKTVCTTALISQAGAFWAKPSKILRLFSSSGGSTTALCGGAPGDRCGGNRPARGSRRGAGRFAGQRTQPDRGRSSVWRGPRTPAWMTQMELRHAACSGADRPTREIRPARPSGLPRLVRLTRRHQARSNPGPTGSQRTGQRAARPTGLATRLRAGTESRSILRPPRWHVSATRVAMEFPRRPSDRVTSVRFSLSRFQSNRAGQMLQAKRSSQG